LKLDDYQQSLLIGWEEIFKKGQLTLWIALALKAGPKHMAEIKDFIIQLTNGTTDIDDRSIYRALRRYHNADIVAFTMAPSDNGPERKIYHLTNTGKVLVDAFCKRNIISVFYKSEVKKLIEKGVQ
jgi:DNA-binding PadR family transcriptional regulator